MHHNFRSRTAEKLKDTREKLEEYEAIVLEEEEERKKDGVGIRDSGIEMALL